MCVYRFVYLNNFKFGCENLFLSKRLKKTLLFLYTYADLIMEMIECGQLKGVWLLECVVAKYVWESKLKYRRSKERPVRTKTYSRFWEVQRHL